MTLQPKSNAGKVRRVLDKNPDLPNNVIAQLVGPCSCLGGSRVGILSSDYVAAVRRKFGYPKPKHISSNVMFDKQTLTVLVLPVVVGFVLEIMEPYKLSNDELADAITRANSGVVQIVEKIMQHKWQTSK